MSTDLISIIVPIYNVEKYLDRCLASIKNQTYTNIEVIMVNDGSKDSSRKIAEKYQTEDTRFKLFDKENGGLSSARNYGMNFVNGKFVSFIDSDDFLETWYVEKLFTAFDENTDIVVGDYVIFNAKDHKSYLHGPQYNIGDYSTFEEKKKLLSAMFAGYPVMSVWKNMYRVPFLKNNKLEFTSERLVYAEDKLFHTEAYTLARNVRIIPDIVFHHLIVPGSLSQSYRNNYYEMSKELHSRIRGILMKYYDEGFAECYDKRIPSEIGAAMFNLCKCGIGEAISNMNDMLHDDSVIASYQNSYSNMGFLRYRILYKIGKLKSPFIIAVTVKVMLLSNPIYRFVQRKKEYSMN